ncbi:CHRD domain-containing protein [Komagataeibacter xylinus]|uniref:CHRD domain-containing protein n=1 Tax=Komagataeibacter xylinus TaxID=28448 RepID=A0A857FM17_KOMXY|nr:CHRD domain-containing protein [Komagataeibacter xylinus]QHC35252.1 CHRD domain-containing protein [Komagataeibacter xylinus]
MIRFSALPALVVASVAFASPALASVVRFEGHFAGEHGATSQPEGKVEAALNTRTNLVKYVITWSGLSGPVTAAHFHGPAPAGEEAGVLVPIPSPYKSGQHGSVLLSAEQAQALQNGQVYVNLHTAALPNGEARAQIERLTPPARP